MTDMRSAMACLQAQSGAGASRSVHEWSHVAVEAVKPAVTPAMGV
jgi:hypothetical protein